MFADCKNGFYGNYCEIKCGSCFYEKQCDQKTGTCSGGCKNTIDYVYIPPLCQTGNIFPQYTKCFFIFFSKYLI